MELHTASPFTWTVSTSYISGLSSNSERITAWWLTTACTTCPWRCPVHSRDEFTGSVGTSMVTWWTMLWRLLELTCIRIQKLEASLETVMWSIKQTPQGQKSNYSALKQFSLCFGDICNKACSKAHSYLTIWLNMLLCLLKQYSMLHQIDIRVFSYQCVIYFRKYISMWEKCKRLTTISVYSGETSYLIQRILVYDSSTIQCRCLPGSCWGLIGVFGLGYAIIMRISMDHSCEKKSEIKLYHYDFYFWSAVTSHQPHNRHVNLRINTTNATLLSTSVVRSVPAWPWLVSIPPKRMK